MPENLSTVIMYFELCPFIVLIILLWYAILDIMEWNFIRNFGFIMERNGWPNISCNLVKVRKLYEAMFLYVL